MELIREFGKIGKGDAGIAGGKGASLGEMTRAGIPVPPGFVILSDAFERFIEETDLNIEIDAILATVNTEEMHTVENASGKIQELILAARMPEDIRTLVTTEFGKLGAEFVAVRSSATAEDSASAAWAGQLDTYLNTTKETLLENVQRCWASLFTPRAIFYRFEKGLHDTKISVAVVVQKMVNSDAAGIAFSVHPVTEDYNQLIIEAGFGLGEAVVSGQVTPDSYVVTKVPREILDKNIATQERSLIRANGGIGGNEWVTVPEPKASSPVLTDAQILALAETVCGIEKHYGFPCDIEWAMESDVIYITQSRPITTLTPPVAENPLPGAPEPKPKDFNSAPSSKEDGAGPRHNFKSPVLKNFNAGEWQFHGLWREDLFSAAFWVEWFDTEALAELGVSLPNAGVGVLSAGHFFYHKATLEKLRTQILERIARKDKKFFSDLISKSNRVFKNSIVFGKSTADSAVTPERFREFLKIGRAFHLHWCLSAVQLSVIFEDIVREAASAHSFSLSDIARIIPQLSSPLIEQQKELIVLKQEVAERSFEEVQKDAALLRELEVHRKKYGWIQIGNWVGEELALESLFEQIQNVHQPQVPAVFVREVPKELRFIADLFSIVGYAKQAGAEYCSMLAYHTRPFLCKVAEKLGVSYQELMHLSHEEILSALDNNETQESLRARIAFRGNTHWFVAPLDGSLVHLVYEPEDIRYLESIMIPRADPFLTEVHGDTGNPGKVKARVSVVTHVSEFSKMKKGNVLITTMTTPEYVTLMQKASAIVTDIGGLLCHASIISRELGKPCVVGTKFATQVFKDGDMVEVDAERGVVHILEQNGKAVG